MRRIKRQALSLLVMILTVLTAGCQVKKEEIQLEEAQLPDNAPEGEESGGSAEKEEKSGEKETAVYVYVCGQVTAPGVYELPAGSRVYEAVKAAGGLLDTAWKEAVNQAEKVEDGQQIYIPDQAERILISEEAGGGDKSSTPADGRVDLNTADRDTLMTLTGIGQVKADAIINYREEHGGFQSPEEIKQVEGIKEGTYDKIKDDIKI